MPVSIKDLAEAVARNIKPSAKVVIQGIDSAENVTRYVPSIAKIKELGVQNFVGLDDALRRTAQWSTESMRT
jgi:nucleoside-diphosphate-sugar epimerase